MSGDRDLIDPDMPAQQLRLHMGEMSAQEMRTARAAIRWANTRLATALSDGERRGLERAAEVAEKRFTIDRVPKTKKGRPYITGEAAIYAATAIAAEIRALIPEVPAREGWQPIETAPRDGTIVDLWHEDFGRQAEFKWGHTEHCCGEYGSYCDSDWHREEAGWVDTALNERFFTEDDFTHWRPLPPPPSLDQRK